MSASWSGQHVQDAMRRAVDIATYVWRRDCDNGRRRRDEVEIDVQAMEEGLRLLREAIEVKARPHERELAGGGAS